jgi:hypothetical protein
VNAKKRKERKAKLIFAVFAALRFLEGIALMRTQSVHRVPRWPFCSSVRCSRRRVLQKTADAQSKGAVMARASRSDPMWPKPLPTAGTWVRTIGVGVDAQDHIWIIHRSDSLDQVEAPPTSRRGRAARKPRRSWNSNQQGNLLRPLGRQGR